MKIESIAAVCHEANRRYCAEIGDVSQKSWEEAPFHQQQSAIAGVIFTMQNPEASLSAQHDNWMKYKQDAGWKYGTAKDDNEKTHPFILPYDQLPPEQRVKDRLFQQIVRALSFNNGENNV